MNFFARTHNLEILGQIYFKYISAHWTFQCERSISVLRLLKTYLRSTMGQERMTSLALMYIHRDMEVKETDIVSDFARSHPRKMKLPNILFSQD